MGYRANVVTRQRDYGSQTFANHPEFTGEFIPNSGLDISSDDNETFFEVNKKELQEYVNNTLDDEEESDYPSYTNQELKKELQTAIDETKEDYVSWEWF